MRFFVKHTNITDIATYSRAFCQAVELEMLPKNPAGKLAVPKSRKRSMTKHLTPEEISQILFH